MPPLKTAWRCGRTSAGTGQLTESEQVCARAGGRPLAQSRKYSEGAAPRPPLLYREAGRSSAARPLRDALPEGIAIVPVLAVLGVERRLAEGRALGAARLRGVGLRPRFGAGLGTRLLGDALAERVPWFHTGDDAACADFLRCAQRLRAAPAAPISSALSQLFGRPSSKGPRSFSYLTSTVAPTSSSCALIESASSCGTPSLTGFGAPSTRSLASLRPRPVIARTTLITWIF
jgi:hypothetical protein